jgi:hypothetical protein
VFQLGADLCTVAPPAVTAAFTAQSGKQASEKTALAVAGCTARPRVTGAITRLRTGKPRVRVVVEAAKDSADLRQVRVLLPDAMTAKPKRKRVGVRVMTGTRRLARKAIAFDKDGELRLTLPAGVRSLIATMDKGAVRVGRKLRKAKPPRRLKLQVLVRDADGTRPTVALRVKPRRR